MGVHGTIRHTVRHRIHHPVLRFAIRLLPGSRIRANLRAERTAGTFWTFLACQREVVPEFLRTLVFARPRGDDQFADCTFSPSLDMSR